MLSANETIKNAPAPEPGVNPDGSKTVKFRAEYGQALPVGPAKMEALVRVGRDGEMSLATYFARK